MAQSLLAVRKRINTVQSIRKITKAMKLIASSRYNKLKEIYDSNTAYISSLKYAMELCLQRVDFEKTAIPTCLTKNPGNKKLYIFITPTLGLCGSYYYNLDKLAKKYLTKDDDCIFIGEKGYKHYKNKVNLAIHDYVGLNENLTLNNVNYFRHELDKLYRDNLYSEIYIIYTKYLSSMSTEARIEQLLPLKEAKVNYEKPLKLPFFDGQSAKVADLIVPHYLDALIYRYFLESLISEQTCRKNSMENATSSADKLIYNLKLEYNKIRQQKITQEITEIVSGNNDTLS